MRCTACAQGAASRAADKICWEIEFGGTEKIKSGTEK